MNVQSLSVHSSRTMELFLILHEQAYRPEGLEYEYMSGRLAKKLTDREFGRVLTVDGERRARKLGRRLAGLGLAFVVTGDFITPLEASRVIAGAAGNGRTLPVVTDSRLRESDLSYLTRKRFRALGRAEAQGDPNATIRDWIDQRPADFADLVAKHISFWNELVEANGGKKVAIVLHVEGLLLYPVLLLSSPPEKLACFHIPRAHPVHIRLFPDRPPLVSFGDESYWAKRPATLFGQYG